ITSTRWKGIAAALKAALKAVGFKQDPVATADAARILRPVGTTNPKNGNEVKVVRTCPLYEPDEIENIVGSYTGVEDDEVDLTQHRSSGMFDEAADLSTTNYPKSSGHVIRTKCIALNDVVSNADTASEPEWRGMLGLVKFTIEGEELAHEWSRPHANYIPDETQAKLDGWQTGPTTCEYFDDLEMCIGCRFKSPTLKSPIMLGVEAVVEVRAGSVALGSTFTVSIPWPFGWDRDKGHMYRKIKTDDGIEKRPVCTSLVIIETRIRNDDGTYDLKCWRQMYYDKEGVEPDQWDDFRVPSKFMGRPADLAAELASNEVVSMGKTGNTDMVDLFKAYSDQLRGAREETVSYRQFGFDGRRDDIVNTSTKFILGTQAIDDTGEWTDVLCSDHVPKDWQVDFGQAGTWEDWAALI
ncbi:MAG: hypothetical protein HKM24_07490, partial [Gammaproteobacteria bacterium]|nr:hypothetical protein [Gammaproteobacteria bacterium]